MNLPFTNGFYQSRSLPLSAQRCVNWYKNVSEVDTFSRDSLFGTAGLSLVDAGDPLEPNRGAHVMNDEPYFVNGNNLYKMTRTVSADGVETLAIVSIGAISGSGRVSMADNGSQLCIVVPNGDAYIYDGSTLSTISDAAFDGPCETVVFISGYFVFNKTNSSKIFHSELRDGLSYNALDFAEAEADPDRVVALHAHRGVLYALGTETIQPFAVRNSNAFAFAPILGGVISKGIRSRFAVRNFGSTFAFVGGGENEGESIWAFRGSDVAKISTTPLDFLLQNATPEQLDECYAFAHSLNGAEFWGVTFGARTLVYDQTASRLSGRLEWHERSSRIDSVDVQWRVASIVTAYNKTFVGDIQNGRIGELSDDFFDEYGEYIVRTTSGQPFSNEGSSMSVSSIEATLSAGTGTPTKDPKLGLCFSDDGGRTYSNMMFRGLGKLGDYERRTIWRRLGRFGKYRVLCFEFAGKTDPTFIKVEAQVS